MERTGEEKMWKEINRGLRPVKEADWSGGGGVGEARVEIQFLHLENWSNTISGTFSENTYLIWLLSC